jgi:hypothetical protein
VLRRIFGPKRDEIVGGWKNCIGELHNSHFLSNIIIVIKSMRIRWAGDIAHIGKKIHSYKVLVGKPEEKRLRT